MFCSLMSNRLLCVYIHLHTYMSKLQSLCSLLLVVAVLLTFGFQERPCREEANSAAPSQEEFAETLRPAVPLAAWDITGNRWETISFGLINFAICFWHNLCFFWKLLDVCNWVWFFESLLQSSYPHIFFFESDHSQGRFNTTALRLRFWFRMLC